MVTADRQVHTKPPKLLVEMVANTTLATGKIHVTG
jgi:hypothetical protein